MVRQERAYVEELPLGRDSKELLAELQQKCTETWEHSLRVGGYCRIIGQVTGLSDREREQLTLLAVFHDIGKLEISRQILQKQGSLTPYEWTVIRRHPEAGYRLAAQIPDVRDIAEGILRHHENWDGSGYPSGLKEKQIPYLCRILAVADAFDAMTSDRSYRKAMTWLEAFRELQLSTGKQFDPEIVRLCLTCGSESAMQL